MGEVVVAVLGGLSGLLMAVAAIITAARRATASVQADAEKAHQEKKAAEDELAEERRRRSSERASERQARHKADTVIYALLGVAERGEPYTDEIRRHVDAFHELASNLDQGDSQESGVST